MSQPPLGILILDTRFERIEGDVGCATSFPFPVRYHRVDGATVARVVSGPADDDELFERFVAGGLALAAAGCIGIATTCGFLARWQRQLATRLPVPVATSALLQIPAVQAMLPADRCVGVVTYSADDLGAAHFEALDLPALPPIEGLALDCHFRRVIGGSGEPLDRARMAADVVDAAQRLIARHPDVGAVVLECANMPPYAHAVRTATGRSTFDALTLLHGFYQALPPLTPLPAV